MRGQLATVVMPYTVRHDEAEAAIAEYDPVMVDVSNSDEAYWELLSSLWSGGRTFVIVEHDVVAPPCSIDMLLACPRNWCGFAFPYANIHYVGLGLTKFEGSLLQKYPTAMEKVALMEDWGHPPKHWCRLDAWIQGVLGACGESPHRHDGPVGHIRHGEVHREGNLMPTHGCC